MGLSTPPMPSARENEARRGAVGLAGGNPVTKRFTCAEPRVMRASNGTLNGPPRRQSEAAAQDRQLSY